MLDLDTVITGGRDVIAHGNVSFNVIYVISAT